MTFDPNSVKIALVIRSLPEELEIYVSVGIYNEASIESSLKYEKYSISKEKVTIDGISAIKLTFDDNRKIGSSISYNRYVNLYIPNKVRIVEKLQ